MTEHNGICVVLIMVIAFVTGAMIDSAIESAANAAAFENCRAQHIKPSICKGGL
jgi:hypothetical protein